MNFFVVASLGKYGKRVFACAGFCIALLALPACNIPFLRPADSPPVLPADFITQPPTSNTTALAAVVGGASCLIVGQSPTSAENSGMLLKEEFYNDSTLTSLIDQGLAENRELKMLEQEIQLASNEVLARRGAYLPMLGIGAGTGFERSSKFTRNGAVEEQLEIRPGKRFPDPLPNSGLGLNFTWNLDIWRQMRTAQEAAAQRYVAAMERRIFFVTRLTADIAENYYRLMALDQRLITLDQTIALQERSLALANSKKAAGQGTELAVQRFQAEVRKNQSEKLIAKQDIIEAENRINFLVNRFPEPVPRASAGFYDINFRALGVGIPSQLLQNRADIRQAERELTAAGLDVYVARTRFYPALAITAGIGYEAFNPRYLFSPDAFIANAAGNLVAPLVNKKAIQAEYLSANARQLQSIYNY